MVTSLLIAAAVLLPDTGRTWRASATYGFEAFTRDRSAWHAATVQVGRRTGAATVLAEAVAARRFDVTDAGVALDGYRALWPRAYGNARVQVAPGAQVLPRTDVATEVFQGLAGGWELSAGYRRMAFATTTATIWSAGVARYAGDWYVRARALLVPHEGATGTAGTLAVRRYLATAEDYVDLQVGGGREVVGTGAGGADVRTTRFAAATWRRSVRATLGIALGGSWNATGGFPTRRGLTLGVTHRW